MERYSDSRDSQYRVSSPTHMPPFPSPSLSVSQHWEAAIHTGDGRQLSGRCSLSSSPRGILQTAIISWFPPFKPVLHRPQKHPSREVSRAFHSNYTPWTRPYVFPQPRAQLGPAPQTGDKLSSDLLGLGLEDRGRKTKSNHSISGLFRAK